MPFHGEYRMLKTHADLAIECGLPKENTFILENGDVLSLRKGVIKKDKSINEGLCLVCAQELGIKPVDDLLKKMEAYYDKNKNNPTKRTNFMANLEAMQKELERRNEELKKNNK